MKTLLYSCIILAGLAGVGVFASDACLSSVYSTCHSNTQLSVRIYNSYSGSIQRAVQSGTVVSGTALWTKQDKVHAIITASKDSSFTSSGNVLSFTGFNTTVGGYSQDQLVTLGSQDGKYDLFVDYLRNGFEPYTSNTIAIYKDTTAPTTPFPLGPSSNSLETSDTIQMLWDASTDTGIGLSYYLVSFSLLPDMSASVSFQVSNNNLSLLSTQLPLGTLYWKIDAVDYLGNTSSGQIRYFHNQVPSTKKSSSNNGSNGISTLFFGSASSNIHGIDHNATTQKSIDTTPKKKKRDTVLILGDGSHMYIEEKNQGKVSLKTLILDKFHESPGAKDWIIPTILPKTGVWGVSAPDKCNYEVCDSVKYNFGPRWCIGIFLLFILIKDFIKKVVKIFDK